jgi:hypothetical protein
MAGVVAAPSPVSAAQTLSVDVSTNTTSACCCDSINVTATVDYDNGVADNITATISWSPSRDLTRTGGDAKVSTKVIDNGGQGTWSWILHCEGPGHPGTPDDVEITVEATSEDEGATDSGSVTVEQRSGELVAVIVAPDDNEGEDPPRVSACDMFDVTFYIENTGCNAVRAVIATVQPTQGIEVGDYGGARDGESWTTPSFGRLEAGETTGNYTVEMHCVAPGLSAVHILPYGMDVCGKYEVVGESDMVEIEQVFALSCNATPTKVCHNTTFTGIIDYGTADPPATVAWNWTFGDGAFAEDASHDPEDPIVATHHYDAAGNYTAVLTVVDDSVTPDRPAIVVTCNTTAVVYPALNVTCNVTSGAIPNVGCTELPKDWLTKVGEEVCFNATKVGGFPMEDCNYTWVWDFGDGTNATAENVESFYACHTYNSTGNKHATVTLTDDCLDNVASCNVSLEVYDELGLNCTVSRNVTKVEHCVNFTAERTGGFDDCAATYAWSWEVKDDGGSTVATNDTPNWTWCPPAEGNYTATVMLWDNTALNNTATCNTTVRVYPALNVTCGAEPDYQHVCHPVDLWAIKTGGVPESAGVSYNWSWEIRDSEGDLVASESGQNVTYTFMCVGNYSATVTVCDDLEPQNCANCTTDIEIYIEPPELYTPENGAQLTSKNVTFEWEDIGCCEYTLEVWQKEADGQKVWTVDTGKETSVSLNLFNGDWRWFVTARDACNNTEVSDTWYFQVDQPGPGIMVISPNGGEVWTANQTYPITWAASPTDGVIDIAYTTDGGDTWVDEATDEANDGIYLWTTPVVESDLCMVKLTVTDTASGSAFDTSDNVFTITSGGPTVDLTSPVGGENWMGGSAHDITWTVSGGATSVELWFSSDNGGKWSMLDGGAGLSSPYAWTLPTVTSQECLVKVVAEDALGNVSIDVSGLFTIDSEYPDVNVKYPNGGETLMGGSDATITWSASDFWPMQGFQASQAADLDIDLYYSTDGGGSWTNIATGEDNDGAYPWTVPSEDSAQCLVKVVAADQAGNEGSDTSDSVFSIWTMPGPLTSIDLKSEWNLISLPQIPGVNGTANYDIDWVLSNGHFGTGNVSAAVVMVYYYDPVADVWLWWNGSPASTLTTMEDGKAYWIRMNYDDTLTVPGFDMPLPPELPPTYPVVAGWNMIGFKSTTPIWHGDYLTSVAGDYSIIYGFDATTDTWFNVYPRNEHSGMLEPTYGYWIWMDSAGTIVP